VLFSSTTMIHTCRCSTPRGLAAPLCSTRDRPSAAQLPSRLKQASHAVETMVPMTVGYAQSRPLARLRLLLLERPRDSLHATPPCKIHTPFPLPTLLARRRGGDDGCFDSSTRRMLIICTLKRFLQSSAVRPGSVLAIWRIVRAGHNQFNACEY
jgi:hypothetical protein